MLAALILAVGSFAAGALAHGQGATAQAVAGPTGTRGQGFTGGEGFPAGGFGQPGAAAGGAVSGSGAGAAGSSAGATALPAVIGTVVEVDGRTLTVRNLGGRTVKVIVPDGVDVTTTSAGPLSKLAEGRLRRRDRHHRRRRRRDRQRRDGALDQVTHPPAAQRTPVTTTTLRPRRVASLATGLALTALLTACGGSGSGTAAPAGTSTAAGQAGQGGRGGFGGADPAQMQQIQACLQAAGITVPTRTGRPTGMPTGRLHRCAVGSPDRRPRGCRPVRQRRGAGRAAGLRHHPAHRPPHRSPHHHPLTSCRDATSG
ncbi:hypothetical protein GCM10025868_27000 [Angustibacter aerolatus]|uniref:DUF5666 domain-containing protein n=1 Tax=Angustibacter aerolatus TaxID=1162965 RepID=A0ABQ6JGX0_9ACTN|nr:hypothetical protein [Angustibacter aerolatus]GMA87450.1 hypothetical protein GCM10025868_27000 [Angustibacter aerolatus]